MDTIKSYFEWVGRHKWMLLLIGLVGILIISPISEVFDDQDNIISPIVAGLFMLVAFGSSEKRMTMWCLAALTGVWLTTSFLTDGSGIFAGRSYAAPILFMMILISIIVLLARWLVRVVFIDTEVLCAAICGYLLLGILWTGIYSFMLSIRPDALVSADNSKMDLSSTLYYSYTTLTTIGFGDILPKHAEIRMITITEAITGIFYNTIVIARFVGLYGIRR